MIRTTLLTLALILGASLALSAQSVTDLDRLVRRGGLYLDPGTGEPFSGPVEARWENDVVRERGTLERGQWVGLHEWFHLNGRISGRETFRDGVLEGPSEAYFKSGQLSVRETYRSGVLHGPYESYWNRGQLAELGAWADGEPCGEWTSFGLTLTFPPCPGGAG